MNPRLRVIHVDAVKGWSGGQVQALNLVRGLATRGHSVVVVCNRGAIFQARALQAGLDCLAVPMRHALDVRAVATLWRLAREFRPHVMHLHSSGAHAVGAVAARLARVPAVVAHKRTDYLPDPILSKWRWGSLIDAAIAVSGPAKLSLVCAGVPAASVHVIYSAVDCAAFRPIEGQPQQLGLPGNTPIVGAVGALDPHKGYHVLLAAASAIRGKVPDAHFVFCGKGSAEQTLRSMARSLGPGVVTFLGQLKDVRPALAAMDVFVHPAFREALGVAVLEAMAMGKAIVATATGGIPEAVEHGISGLLVPVGDAAALADAIVRLLGDEQLRRALGQAARERAKAVFSVEAMVSATERLYYSLLDERRRKLSASS